MDTFPGYSGAGVPPPEYSGKVGMLDVASRRIVSLSDFEQDSTPTRRIEALRVVKDSIELGLTLLLVNCAPLHTALYDVFNRYHATSNSSEGTLYFAQISLGSISHRVKVHSSFRVVVHLATSNLPSAHLPFLNRFSNYFPMSIADVLRERVAQLGPKDLGAKC